MFKLSAGVSGVALVISMMAGAVLAPQAQAQVQAATPAAANAPSGQVNVVYHINDSRSQALGGLRNMRNHLDVAPETNIVVVAHAGGIDFLTTSYDDAATVGPLVAGLAARGVVFEVCEITLRGRDLTHDDFVLEADFTPSGVARIGQLQALEGYAYIKP